MSFAKGTKVRQIVTPVEGEVESYQVDQNTGELLVLVSWSLGDDQQSKYFKLSELEVIV
jgi:hypothetical protein